MSTEHPELNLLIALNRGYVLAAQNTDLDWYREHLADNYMSRSPDGSLTDKEGFLRRIASQAGGGWSMEPLQPQVQWVGEGEGRLALIHSGFRMWRKGAADAVEEAQGYYTDIWRHQAGWWRCVMAHFSMK